MPTTTWKHGGGLVPQPAPEENATAAKTKGKPGPVPAGSVLGIDPGAEEGDRTVATLIEPATAGAAELIRGE